MSDPFGLLGRTLTDLLLGWGLTAEWAQFILTAAGAFLMAVIALTTMLFTIWAERKILARFQDRLGPNRIGPWGIFQTVADMVKLITKEIIFPQGVDLLVYVLAPPLVVMAVIGLWAVIPLAPGLMGANIGVGVLYIVAVGAIGALAIIMAGWSSNNKYALLGAFRAVAQLVSYEVPMVLALLIPTMLSGSMHMSAVVEQQGAAWYILLAPVAAAIFFISSIAEVGRSPFDLLEAESEIVAGYMLEYSGMMFGMFYVADFLHALTISALMTTLFLGGWQGPGAEAFPLLGLLYFAIKTGFIYFLGIWIRGSLPRLRIDQMLDFNWKFLTPLALVAVMVTAIADKAADALAINRMLVLLGANLVLAGATFMIIGWVIRRARRRAELTVVAQS